MNIIKLRFKWEVFKANVLALTMVFIVAPLCSKFKLFGVVIGDQFVITDPRIAMAASGGIVQDDSLLLVAAANSYSNIILGNNMLLKMKQEVREAIIAHEQGHIVMQHRVSDDPIEMEHEADAYATLKGHGPALIRWFEELLKLEEMQLDVYQELFKTRINNINKLIN